ncbi:MAG TPA: hypothetical protein VFS21_06355 [Roseiflexaceae bacterium]|nr:hypothetical protein [Roseiflexaceae bacterium]
MKHTRIAQWRVDVSPKTQYEVTFWLAVLLLTASVSFAYFLRFPWRDMHSPQAEFFIQETTHRPFAYRVLLPVMTELARLFVPLDPMVYQGVLMFVFFVGFTVALRTLAQTFWAPSRALDYLVLFSIPLAIPLSLDHQHTYDLPLACLFTWGIVWIAQKKWVPFLFCYTIACFNKETTLFLTVIFAVCWGQRYNSRQFWRLLAMQLSIYAIIRVSLMYIFRHNPGTLIGYNLPYHVVAFQLYPVKSLVYLANLVLVGALIGNRLRDKPLFLRKALFSTLPFMLIMYVFSGYPFEIRIFYEVYALLLLLCLPPRLFITAAAGEASAAGHHLPTVRA